MATKEYSNQSDGAFPQESARWLQKVTGTVFVGENTRAVLNTLLFLYKSLTSLVHFYLSFSKSLLSAPSLADHTLEKTWATTTLPPCPDRRCKTQRGGRGCGVGEWLMPLRCLDRGERWNKEIRMRWERKVTADLSLIWRHLWAYTDAAAAAQKPCNNWAGCRSSTSGSRSDGDPIEDVMETGSIHQPRGQTLW